MRNKNKVPLSSSEIASLWTSYMQDSLAICVLKYFFKKVEDDNVKPQIKHALELSQQHISKLKDFFHQENIPVPYGFTDEDINLNAPRLFSDSFMLFYIVNMGRIGMNGYALSLNHVARPDIRAYFTECIIQSVDMYNRVADILLSMGLFIRSPLIEVPKEVHFIHKESFLSGFFGKPRMLLTTEIMHIFANILTNIVGHSLITGFAQTAQSRDVREYLYRGADISNKHSKVFYELLSNEAIPIPASSDMGVTDSTTTTFSEKLMMFHALILNQTSIGSYGIASGTSMRSDLITNYTRLMAEIAHYSKDGIDIIIENGWMEQPPQAINHKNLTKN